MRQGNALFERGEPVQAMASYEQARALAQAHFEHWPDADRATAALVVSSLNLAEAQAGAQRLEAAASTLCAIHAWLVLSASDGAADPVQRRAALHHMRETTAMMMRFQALHGAWPNIREGLVQGCHVMARLSHAAASAPSSTTLQ